MKPTPLLVLLALGLVACPRAPSPLTPRSGDCPGACQRLRDLDCPEAEPTPAGAPCEAWCQKYADKPAGIDPACIARAESCGQVDGCGR
jgi:hypothetical protein